MKKELRKKVKGLKKFYYVELIDYHKSDSYMELVIGYKVIKKHNFDIVKVTYIDEELFMIKGVANITQIEELKDLFKEQEDVDVI